MLTVSCVRVGLVTRPVACIVGAAALSVITLTAPAKAEVMARGGCIGGIFGSRSVNCVVRWGEAGDPYIRTVPQPADETARSQAAERERKWEQRCRPTIAQDRFGVPRYRYSAAGCEFGVIQ